MKLIRLTFAFCLFYQHLNCAEKNNDDLINCYNDRFNYNSNHKYGYAIKFIGTINFDIRERKSFGSLGVAMGGWLKNDYLQFSTNIAYTMVLGTYGLGNKSDRLQSRINNKLFYLTISNYLTGNLFSKTNWYLEEINPMYFGHASGVYNSYQNAITIGTSFITIPKGTYRNIVTPRNRSQQLITLQAKFGPSANGLNSVIFHLYEDYLGSFFVPLSDMRDRFFTGGGNLQLRIMQFYTLKYFTETYTGNSYIDKQDYPDLITNVERRNTWPKKKYKGYYTRFAFQDNGQLGFNRARSLLIVEIPIKISNPQSINSTVEFVYGWSGTMQSGWQQHLIHSLFKERKTKTFLNTESNERLHQFDYRNTNRSSSYGFSSKFITINKKK
jgi:hypothetical protein